MAQNNEEDYDKQRTELLDRFAQALKGADLWFDEDDLLDIFDFAGDVGNEYLRAEALMWGARYFPDSKRLRERRAVFYADVLSDNAVQQLTADHKSESEPPTALTRIISARSSNFPTPEAKQKLDQLAAEFQHFDDEEIIQLVNMAYDTRNMQWVYDNLDSLTQKVSYKPALLYEVAATAFESGDFIQSQAAAEKLIADAPYCADFWELLAQGQEALGKLAEAEESIDMSLAIAPDNLRALKMKTAFLAERGDHAEIETIYRTHPDDASIAENYVRALYRDRNPSTFTESEHMDMLDFVTQFPDSEFFFTNLVMYAPHLSDAVLDRHWSISDQHDTPNLAVEWQRWAKALYGAGAVEGVKAVLLCMHRNLPDDIFCQCGAASLLAETCLNLSLWDDAAAYSLMLMQSPAFNFDADTLLVRITALLRLGKLIEAKSTATAYLMHHQLTSSANHPLWSNLQHLSNLGLTLLLRQLLLDMQQPQFDATTYDPRLLWPSFE